MRLCAPGVIRIILVVDMGQAVINVVVYDSQGALRHYRADVDCRLYILGFAQHFYRVIHQNVHRGRVNKLIGNVRNGERSCRLVEYYPVGKLRAGRELNGVRPGAALEVFVEVEGDILR